MTPSEADLRARREATLEGFLQAWRDHDLQALLALMTEDCVYAPSLVSAPGHIYRGKAEVAAGIRRVWAADRAVESHVFNRILMDDHAVWEWRYRLPPESPDPQAHGCDILTFAGTLIRRKEAFRKIYDPA
ncbi:MAG: nuclear transport factor 2 family protein [Alphaproteobacteria bacterium]|nr:nuclear transport factor 2 family protein [Alphaproteobacteria bacterium]